MPTTKLVQAKQTLVKVSCNPAVPRADRQRCLNALVIGNEASRPKALHRRASAPVAAPHHPSAADILADARSILASVPNGDRGLAVLAQHDPTLMASLDREIPSHLRDQLNAGAESQSNEARQREFLAQRFGT